MSEDRIRIVAREIVDRRSWPNIESDAMVKRAHDVAIDCVMDALRGGPRINPFADVQCGRSMFQVPPHAWLDDGDDDDLHTWLGDRP